MIPEGFTTIEQGLQSCASPALESWPLVHPILLVFRQEREFERFWRQHKASLDPVPSPPEIPFDDDMVLAVLDNAERCSGYAIEIRQIEAVDRFLRVTVVKSVPGSECIVAWTTTQPFHLVRLPRSEREILFELTTAILPLEDAPKAEEPTWQ